MSGNKPNLTCITNENYKSMEEKHDQLFKEFKAELRKIMINKLSESMDKG